MPCRGCCNRVRWVPTVVACRCAGPLQPAILQHPLRAAIRSRTKCHAESKDMDWKVIEGRWNEYRAAAKRRWDKLSEAQLAGIRGNRAYLLKRVQEAYVLSAEEADRELAAWQQIQVDRLAPAANGP